jgi:hypothetical protein
MEKNAPHSLPHFHLFLGNTKVASVSVEDGSIIVGCLTNSEKKLIKTFTIDHKKELKQAWNNLQQGKLPKKIKV